VEGGTSEEGVEVVGIPGRLVVSVAIERFEHYHVVVLGTDVS